MLNIKNLIGKIDAPDIQQALNKKFRDHKYVIYNAYIFDWESDYLSVNESEYIYECEIKLTVDDYKKDAHKKNKHLLLESCSNTKIMPNKFFYVTPRGVLPSFTIPKYAGLIEIESTTKGMIAEVIINAPFLHREKNLESIKPILLEKFFHKYVRTELENYDLRNQVEMLQGQIKQLNESSSI